MQGPTPSIVDALELFASQRPDLVRWLLTVLEIEPVEEIAERWRIDVEEISATAVRTASDLDRIERDPQAQLVSPNVRALVDLAEARWYRLGGADRQHTAAQLRSDRGRDVVNRFLQRDALPLAHLRIAKLGDHGAKDAQA